MIDVALVPTGEALDLVLEAGDLKLEHGLRTAVLVSLFTDATADADDELPDASGDRRGWWAEGLLAEDRGDQFGSLLWLLERSKLSDDVLVAAEEHVRASLDWLRRAGIAERVEVSSSRLDRSTLFLEVRLVRGEAVERADLWTAEFAAELEVGPARFRLVAVP